ncbi:MAG: hypothetical protein HYV90_00860 [Candidatus Woesebacteria bacterium]|nr:MAG: hypothetical protein HYV90_00860 [Candidatus Woesebacteria bacterium]
MDRIDLDSVDLAHQWRSANKKETIAPNLEQNAPSEYYDMVACLKRGEKWVGPAKAVRGFHFSPKVLNEVVPNGGELFFFPERPTIYQSKQIAELSQSAPGWNRRGNMRNRDLGTPEVVFCCAIAPDDKDLDVQVTVEPNADYFGLMGLRVVVDGSIKWQIVDRKIVLPAAA